MENGELIQNSIGIVFPLNIEGTSLLTNVLHIKCNRDCRIRHTHGRQTLIYPMSSNAWHRFSCLGPQRRRSCAGTASRPPPRRPWRARDPAVAANKECPWAAWIGIEPRRENRWNEICHATANKYVFLVNILSLEMSRSTTGAVLASNTRNTFVLRDTDSRCSLGKENKKTHTHA